MHSKYFAIEKYLECKLHLKLIVFLSDSIHRANQLFICQDSSASHQVEYQRDSWEYSWPRGTETYSTPRLITHHLTYNKEYHIPTNDKQHIEQAEQSLHLTVVIYKYGVGSDYRCRQQNSHQGPSIKMMLANGVGVPKVIHLCHRDTTQLE